MYTVRHYETRDHTQLLTLQTGLWHADIDVNAAYFEWKYSRNPYIQHNHIYLAFDGEQLVGMLGAFGAEWAGGALAQPAVIPCFADLYILPAHRDKTLFPQLMAAAQADLARHGYPYAFDASASELVLLNLLMSRQWRAVTFVEEARWRASEALLNRRMRKRIRHLPLIGAAYKAAGKWLKRDSHSQFDADAAGRAAEAAGASFRPKTFKHLDRARLHPPLRLCDHSQPQAMARLVAKIGRNDRICHTRDERFFAWRYQNPLSDYRFIYCGQPELSGYLVLQAPHSAADDKNVLVVDHAAENEEVFAALLQAALRHGNFDKISLWTQALSSAERAVLLALGFVLDTPSGRLTADLAYPTLLIHQLGVGAADFGRKAAPQSLYDAASWHILPFYSDNF